MSGPTAQETVVLASGNAGKLHELGALLAPLGMTLRPQSEYGVPEGPLLPVVSV